ncbi:hypothetical protein [Eggerthella guodeyinii]|uniref:Uncharacterized protein n=1 Tax=Eggerthella guodeyinii TaxID=2690837 RepID=A0A6N7RL48_9ACTN|nr:hypothetical protein [Eggerthella guodeyinii]MRX81641.1 hypothetical protein [Eggerthella guodeyinii]
MSWHEPGTAGPKRMRDRKAAVAVALVAVLIQTALYFAPLVVQYAEGDTAEVAIATADGGAGGEYAFSLEREYADEEGRTVYRCVSDSRPAVVMELRREFRWLPQLRWSQSVVPGPLIDDPGPYYELVNKDEWRESYLEWNREQMRQEAENGGSLLTDPPQGGEDG